MSHTALLAAFSLTTLAATLAAAPSAATAQSAADGTPTEDSPLFASDEVVEVTLVADFRLLERDREDQSPERPATLLVANAAGAPTQLEIAVRTRGNFRLRRSTCAFPNLRLDFDVQPAAAGTIFEGQNDLKLVAHCHDREDYEQNTLEEYVVYRLYNLVTDVSFRVRLARVTYVDVNGTADPITRFGFFVENEDDLAARLGGSILEVAVTDPLLLDSTPSARLELFQYMIGNTDFSVAYFHNAVPVALPNGTYQAVPFDFDFSGIVDAPYATPDPSLGTRTVRQRVYRGFCRSQVDMGELYAFFAERRPEFEELFLGRPEFDPAGARRAVRYLADFFETIESPRARESVFERRCRTVPR